MAMPNEAYVGETTAQASQRIQSAMERRAEFILEVMRSGGRYEYYRGDLGAAVTACKRKDALDCYRSARSLAAAFRAAAEQGRCLLVQKRHGPGDYSYLVVKR